MPVKALAGPLVGAQPFVVDDPREFFLDRTDYDHDARDRDGDGLDDLVELEMALYFQPYLSFESTDYECCLNVGEPAVLVRVAPLDGTIEGQSLYDGLPFEEHEFLRSIVIIYVFYWERDGGTNNVGHDPRGCTGETEPMLGDSDFVLLQVYSRTEGREWFPERMANGHEISESKTGGCFDVYFDEMDMVKFKEETWPRPNPVIYFSSGKHHQFFDFYEGEDKCYWGLTGHGCVYYYCPNCHEYLYHVNRHEFFPLRLLNMGEYGMFEGKVEDETNNRGWEDAGFYNDLGKVSEILSIQKPPLYGIPGDPVSFQ